MAWTILTRIHCANTAQSFVFSTAGILQHEAVREAFTNSIIHSDVFLSGGVLRIDKYDDRLCFRNPGILKLPMEQVYAGGSSKARNPKMQNMLRMIGYGENLGSGFPKILAAWKEAGWQEPLLENCLELDEVRLTLFIPFVETIQDPIQETTQETIQKTIQKTIQNLTEQQQSILLYVKNNPNATRKELCENIPGVTMGGVIYNLSRLQELGIIKREGGRKLGYWKILVDLKNGDV